MTNDDQIILSADAMREADRRTIEEFGVPSFALMETAARGVADEIERRLGDLDGCKVLVLAGKGNNGGDGLALARLLLDRGARVFVVVHVGVSTCSAETELNMKLLRRLAPVVGPRLVICELRGKDLAVDALEPWGSFDLAVDAMLGIGAQGALREPLAFMTTLAKRARLVCAIDVPSGVDADTGLEASGGSVAADFTVTMAATKPCHWFGAQPSRSGEVVIADIGIPRHLLEAAVEMPGSARVAGPKSIRSFLGQASNGDHKFAVGQAGVVAGSNRYSGALVLATTAAARSGAGYVLCASTERAAAALDARVPEIVAVSFRANASGVLPAGAAGAVLEEFKGCRACLVGPGLGYGRSEAASADVTGLLLGLVGGLEQPLVIDADGLNALDSPEAVEALRNRSGATVMTPHPGEFRRLVAASGGNGDLKERQRYPIRLAADWARYFGAVLVLKGSSTVIAAPDGRVYVAPRRSRALATAGTGDVLAGSIVGLLAQGLDPVAASVVAVHLGLEAASIFEQEGRAAAACQASDIVERLPLALGRYRL